MGANDHIPLKELTCNNSSTDARSFTSFTKHRLTKSTKSFDQSDEESEGGVAKIIRFIIFTSHYQSFTTSNGEQP